jgi:hypothetical protein
MVRDLGIKSDPNMHRAHKRPTQSADRSTERRLASAETSEKTGRENEINLCSVGCKYRILRRLGDALLHVLVTKANPSTKGRSSTELRCASSPRSIMQRRGDLSRVKMNAKNRRP